MNGGLNMKKIVKIYIAILAVLCSTTAFAGRMDIHYLGFYGGLGYSGMVNQYQPATFAVQPWTAQTALGNFTPKFLGGGGGILGVRYQLQHNKLIFNVGPEFRMFSSLDKMTFDAPIDGHFTYQDADFTGEMVKHYQFDKLNENQVVGQVMLPVMLGMSFDRYYFLVGAKAGYTLMHTYRQRGQVTASLTDLMAVEDWFELGNHDIVTYKYPEKGASYGRGRLSHAGLGWNGLDVTVSAEFGVNINDFLPGKWNKDNMKRRFPYHFRAAVFLDYGIANLGVRQLNEAGEAPKFATANHDHVETISLHNSMWATSPLNSLLVGVKGEFLLQLNKPKKKREPNPMMVAQVTDQLTGNPLSGVKVNIYNEKTKKTSKKTTNSRGLINQRYAPGNYQMNIPAKTTPSAYLPNLDTLHILHMEDGVDTLQMQLMPKPIVTCYVRGTKSQRYLASEIVMTDAEGNEVTRLSTDTLVGKTLAINTLEWGKTYTVAIHSEGHNDTIDVLKVDGKQAQLEYNFFLSPIIPPKVWILENMHFATAKDIILPESEEALQTLFDYLNENPDKHILITGHTDSVGKDKDNQNLSERRSANVRKAMIERGIDGSRIQTNGKGESEPIDTNETEEGRARNRRVEITVLD